MQNTQESFITRLSGVLSKSYDWIERRAWNIFGAVLTVAISIFLGWILYNVTVASEQIVSCQCVQGNGSIVLTGIREWRPDPLISAHQNLNDCIDAAQKMNCELK